MTDSLKIITAEERRTKQVVLEMVERTIESAREKQQRLRQELGMTDDTLLDRPIGTFDQAYAQWVAHRHEMEETAARWHAEAKGHPASENDINHAMWRVANEYARWGTLRAALQDTWPKGEEPTAPSQPPAPVQPSPQGDGGGLRLSASDQSRRPRYSRSEMDAFLPTTPGPFQFPAPYRTLGCRLTTEADGVVNPVGMSYWANLNNSAPGDPILAFLSLADQLWLYAIDPTTFRVEKVKPIPFHHTGESCYWDAQDQHRLYIPVGGELVAYNVKDGHTNVVASMPGPARQWHSSDDGRVHSCTFEGYAATWREGKVGRYGQQGAYDECQIDRSGRWLLIKVGDDNRIVDLQTGVSWTITNPQGAVGHSDMGSGFMIGEDDYAASAGAFRRWDFTPEGPRDAGLVYHMHGWDKMTRYVGLCRGEVAVYSSASADDRPRANEIVATHLDTSLASLVVCPNLTDLTVEGVDPYWRKPRVNTDPQGRWGIWTANHGTPRLDAFLVKIPAF